MFLLTKICDFPQTPLFPLVLLIAILIATLIVSTLTIYEIHIHLKHLLVTIVMALIIYPVFTFSALFFTFIIAMIMQGDVRGMAISAGSPPHIINAAVKNTCYLDPLRKNCPKNLTELKSIIPQDIKNNPLIQTVSYTYYPLEHQYTLIFKIDSNFWIVFDPSLKNYHEYGYDFMGISQYHCSKKLFPEYYSSKPGVSFDTFTNERNLKKLLPR